WPRRARESGRPRCWVGHGSSSVAHIHIARPRDRLYELRLCRVALDLLAEPCHADVDAAVEGLPVAPMRQVEELAARQHLVGMPGERVQQVELHRRQAELLAILANELGGLELEQPVAETEGVGRRLAPGAADVRIGAS